MSVFAPSDVRSITVSGGCGQPHDAGDLAAGERFTVDCGQCEPLIVATRTGWAHTPDGVSLTPDEIAVAEAQRAQAERERDKTWSAGFQAVAAQFGGGGQAPDLLKQIANLTGPERRALRAMLADDDEPTEAVDALLEMPAPAASPVVRRGPGRPRKNPPTA